ncbi:MAG: glycosyltransferase family 4 protein [Ferrimicrobium sp.]
MYDRVLMVDQLTRPISGGIGTVIEAVAAALAEVDVDRRIQLYHSRPRAGNPLPNWRGPRRAYWLPRPFAQRAWDRGLGRVRLDGRLYHAFSLGGPMLPDRGPVVVCLYDLLFRLAPESFPARARRWHEARYRSIHRGQATVITLDTSVADQLIRDGIAAKRVRVIAPGADHLPPVDREGVRELLDSLGVSGSYLVAVGTIEPRKNLVRILAAYQRYAERVHDPARLIVVGPPGWGATLQVPPGVIETGFVTVPVLAGLIAGSRGLIYVPLAEGFGLPPLEAMASAVPVVVSATIPSARIGGVGVDPLDVAGIADAIEVVAGDDQRRLELVTQGLLGVSEMRWSKTASELVGVWEELSL